MVALGAVETTCTEVPDARSAAKMLSLGISPASAGAYTIRCRFRSAEVSLYCAALKRDVQKPGPSFRCADCSNPIATCAGSARNGGNSAPRAAELSAAE